ncbi:MAG: DUF1573 domain-containing protein [Phycisphaerales bacterium]
MSGFTSSKRARGAGVLWRMALVGAFAAASPALAQLGGGKQPDQPATQPRTVTQDGIRVAPQQTSPNAEPIRRSPPPLSASPERIDLGVMKPGMKRAGSVTITNNGDETIEIARVNSSCSCTVADLPKDTLAPGESVELSATLESGNYIGDMQRQVRVYAKGYAAPYEIWVVADISYDVKADPVYIGAFQGDTGEVKVTEVNGKPFKILSVNSEKPTFKDYTPDSGELMSEYTLVWSTKGVDPKDLPRWWVIETDHPTAPVVDLRMLHPAVLPKVDPRRAWQLGDDRALIGYLEPGESTKLTLEIKERRRAQEELPLPEVATTRDDMTVEVASLEKTPDGYALELTLTAKNGGAGKTLIAEPISIKWRDSEETYWVFGRLTKQPGGEHARAD